MHGRIQGSANAQKLMGFYTPRGISHHISAAGSPSEVAQRIVTVIDQAQAAKQSDRPRLFPLGYGSVILPTRRGRAVKIRHVEPEDAGLLIDLFNRLSPTSRQMRFFVSKPALPEGVIPPGVERLARTERHEQTALLATTPEDEQERAVGLAQLVFSAEDPEIGEVALAMTPRTRIVWLDLDDPLEQNLRKIAESSYSAFPVGQGSPDAIRGVLYAKDILARVLAGEAVDIQAALCPAVFVPESMSAFQALDKIRGGRSHIALVVDEYGGIEEQRANAVVGREVRTTAAEPAPEQAPVLARPDPAATQRVVAVEHTHQHQAEDGGERIAAALSPARVGQGGQAAQQAVRVRLHGHR